MVRSSIAGQLSMVLAFSIVRQSTRQRLKVQEKTELPGEFTSFEALNPSKPEIVCFEMRPERVELPTYGFVVQ